LPGYILKEINPCIFDEIQGFLYYSINFKKIPKKVYTKNPLIPLFSKKNKKNFKKAKKKLYF